MGGDGMFVCGVEPTAPSDALRALAGLAHCCESVMLRGPLACTCWTVEYDLQQAEPHEGVTAAQIVTRAQMCADCGRDGDVGLHPLEAPNAGAFDVHREAVACRRRLIAADLAAPAPSDTARP